MTSFWLSSATSDQNRVSGQSKNQRHRHPTSCTAHSASTAAPCRRGRAFASIKDRRVKRAGRGIASPIDRHRGIDEVISPETAAFAGVLCWDRAKCRMPDTAIDTTRTAMVAPRPDLIIPCPPGTRDLPLRLSKREMELFLWRRSGCSPSNVDYG